MKTLLSVSLFIILSGRLFVPPAVAQDERGVGLNTLSTGRYYALVIGNNAYTSLQKLKTAEADAREVAALLRDAYGFETKLLLNATRGQIISALSAYRRTLEPDSNLLIYYAGHGVNDKDADKAYWLPVDANLNDNSNWIIADEITTALKVIPAKHVLVVSDSCYSGTLTRGLGESLPRPAEREQFLKRMVAGRSRTLMASGGDEPVSDGGGGGHSIFAGALLRGLREMDKQQFTAAELFRNHVEESVAGRASQTPEYNPLRNSGHESGDFVFVRVKAGDKTAEARISAPPPAKVDPAQQELAFWSSIQNSTDAEDFKDYLSRYPDGQFAGIAKRRIQPPAGAKSPVTLATEADIEQAMNSLISLGSTKIDLGKFGEEISSTRIIGQCQIKFEERALWNSKARFKPAVVELIIFLTDINITSIGVSEVKPPDRPSVWFVTARTMQGRPPFNLSTTGYENRTLEKIKVPTKKENPTLAAVAVFMDYESANRYAKAFAAAARSCGAKSETF